MQNKFLLELFKGGFNDLCRAQTGIVMEKHDFARPIESFRSDTLSESMQWGYI